MVDIAITGASGRMGRALIKAVLEHRQADLAAVVARPGSAIVGADAAEACGVGDSGVEVAGGLDDSSFDVLIDFTRPEATLGYLDQCVEKGCCMVIGTTGFDEAQKQYLEKAAASIPIVFAPNMCIGINLILRLLETAAAALGSDADIEIVEAHHRHKVDAPSGTALGMGEVIARELGTTLKSCGVFCRHGHTGGRKPGEIGFSVIRAGDLVGEHTALFALDGERVEITHRASSRSIYANGALRAALWLSAGKPPGIYSMQNVLGLG